jgi:SAM-dependent methyltransferase
MKLRTIWRYLRPRYLRDHRRGFCPVCSRRTIFLLTDTAETIRNHALCVRCGSCSRQRHVALHVLEALRERGVARYADLGARPDIAVYDTSTEGRLARRMAGAPNLTVSEFFDDVPPGESRDGVMCQDLQRLTFADATFDLIVSEDVFEHVPDYARGFREVFRVLKPGGYHVFSIPYHFDRRTRPLFEWREGRPVLFEPVEYHGDPIRGLIPCYTHFGYDLLDILRETGFEARLEISLFGESERFGTFDSFTLVTRKPPT